MRAQRKIKLLSKKYLWRLLGDRKDLEYRGFFYSYLADSIRNICEILDVTVNLTNLSKLHICLLCWIAATISGPPRLVRADDPLSELFESEEVKRLQSQALSAKTSPPDDVPPSGEYWGLFTEPQEVASKIAGWIGNSSSEYTAIGRQPLNSTSGDFVGLKIIYRDKKELRYELQVLIPHPRRFFPADAGLIDEFRDIDDLTFGPDSSDIVQIGSLRGTLLTKLSGECLLKVPLERHSWFTVRQSELCEEPQLLITFAKAFFLERLNVKLHM